MVTVQARAVRYAVEIVGGVELLAARLNARCDDIEAWLAGAVPLPEHIFLQCSHIVMACLLEELGASHANGRAKGSLH
jgi:hypothetical protein